MIARLKTIGKSAEEFLSLLQETLAQWLPTQDATRIDLETSGLGYAGWLDPVLTAQDGTRTRIRDPFAIGSATMNLRRAMADPERGAWTWAHLWMSADELVLHAEYDWNRDIGPADFNCADELDRFPRDAEHTPVWLAEGAARGRRATEIYNSLERALAQWLENQDNADRIDIDSLALGKRTALRTRLTFTDGTTHHDIHLPDQVVSAITAIVDELRGPQVRAEPAAGAWTREQIWMETFDFKLVTFYEWNHDPGFTDTDCADELRLHPRDAEHTPTWLAQGAERARTTPPPHPDENEGVYQAITEQERDARRNS
ncbi:hypothetical protein [Arachnia propionica]|uniref:hypothetical protein n=1 Tax=Arachnia propionica TaxID=1750 RepID=UPI000F6C7B2C|nr:hypothetical protein [Arachnia propionica]VEJ59651.1 Uncharacterised protein [Arachnia propionica]